MTFQCYLAVQTWGLRAAPTVVIIAVTVVACLLLSWMAQRWDMTAAFADKPQTRRDTPRIGNSCDSSGRAPDRQNRMPQVAPAEKHEARPSCLAAAVSLHPEL